MPPVPQRPVHPAATPAEAMARGYFAQVRFLLELSGPTGADARDPGTGRSPLILCALVRDPDWCISLARLLLEKGARVGLKDRRGLNALHYACAHGRDQLSELYLQAIDYRVNDTDGYRNTAMHYAARSGRPVIVEALLGVLARFQLPVSLPNKEGVTPLMLAYMGGHLGIAERLLAAGADAEAVDAFGKTTAVYEREAVERRRADAEAAAAKAAGRRLRFDDIDGWRRHQTRLRSAPARGRSAGGGGGIGSALSATFKEAQREQRRTRMYQPNEADLICVASPLDRRNDPVEVFRATPADFFGPSASPQQQQQLLSISGVGMAASRQSRSAATTAATVSRPRAQSAMPQLLRERSQRGRLDSDSSCDSDRSRDSREMKLLSAAGCRSGANGGGSGSGAMASLFNNYEFHCSSLYRPPPRAPDPAVHVQDFASRFLTPPQAPDADGSDSTPIGRRGRKGKRSTAAAAVAAAVAAETVKKRASGFGGRISRAAFGRGDN